MQRVPLDSLLGYQLRRASSAMIGDLSRDLTTLDLTVPEMSVLWTFDRPGGCSQSECGRTLGIQRANMAPLAARLEQRGLIERSALNGRSHALMLTLAGEALMKRARAVVARHEARFLPQLSAEERAQLVRLLQTVPRSARAAG
jgi:DNA-binding MarR family transcriptional regulator